MNQLKQQANNGGNHTVLQNQSKGLIGDYGNNL
jgi:hypothetical protein